MEMTYANSYWKPITEKETDQDSNRLSSSPYVINNTVVIKEEENGNKAEKNPKEEDETAKEVIEDFVNRSTLHGLQNVYNSRSKLHKLIWIILMLGATCYVLNIISQSVIKFRSHPVNTKTKLVFEKDSTFPAVTLCNFNRYRQLPLMGSGMKEIFDAMSSSSVNNINWKNYNFTGMDMLESENSIAHDITNMLLQCNWKGLGCSYQNFTAIYTSMGKCYTFNSGKDGHPLLKVEGAGENHGLRIMLYTQQYEYAKYTVSAGFKILLHDPDDPPLVKDFGTSVSPGFHSTLSAQKTEVINQELPYEDGCVKNKKLKNYAKYSRFGCIKECMEEYIIERCACRPVEYLTKAKYCNPKELITCAWPHEAIFSQVYGEECADCTEPCRSITYETSSSYSSFPSQVLMQDTINNFRFMFPPNYTDVQIESDFRANLVYVTVFYKQLSYHRVENVPAYLPMDLFGDLGGQIGLFLGCSMLTLMEFVDLLVNLVSWKIRSLKQKRKTSMAK